MISKIIVAGICLILFLTLLHFLTKKSKEDRERTEKLLTEKFKNQVFNLCNKGVTFDEIRELLNIPPHIISNLMKEYYEKRKEEK